VRRHAGVVQVGVDLERGGVDVEAAVVLEDLADGFGNGFLCGHVAGGSVRWGKAAVL
jgi:hypothetical protein